MSADVIPFRRRPASRPVHPGPPPRAGLALTLSVEDGDVVLLADSVRIEFTPVQALDLAGDLRELAEDARGNEPAPLSAPELRARLGLIASELAALDRGEKRVTDVLRLARELTSEVRRG